MPTETETKPEPSPLDLMSKADLMRAMHCSEPTLTKRFKNGELEAIRIGSRIFSTRAMYERYLATRPRVAERVA